MALSRRTLIRAAAAGGLAGMIQLGRSASLAQAGAPYRAMVGVFLFGGNDGWNMVAPTDARHAAYVTGRGADLALPKEALVPLAGAPFGLHPGLAALKPLWVDGGLGVLLNTGSLFQPLDRTLYGQRPDLRPLNLMSHTDEQAHWQGVRMRDVSQTGFMGRIADRMAVTPVPGLVSVTGSELVLLGKQSSPLILPSTGRVARQGIGGKDPAVKARLAALDAYSDVGAAGPMTRQTALGMSGAYDAAVYANDIVSAPASAVDGYFTDPVTGVALTSDIALQLLRVARMIEARKTLGHAQQCFLVGQQGYDLHADQVDPSGPLKGRHADLLGDLGPALYAFQRALRGLGVARDVTTFTMSDFGRAYRANSQRGTDHGWGNNHLVLGDGLAPNRIHGRYPDQAFGGKEDMSVDGRWIPSIAIEEYVGAIAQWFGVSSSDMPYVFPNWATWSGGGRGPAPIFG